ncbi:hypothetical protein M2132_000853 [Dysgonomonas sp. PH5-45]|uniref:phosphatase PAP2 family protein n=1 Tax=unclassified Dysgonomonas TaxID=2630389 RepID=UPI002475381F|nr:MULTISPECIES: phosphatase PAP2 family protein [unclassified Dysgonomonas]MDH6354525.1 hypothetical protein [Dysgonomonas sp. PH5-45]MDH6387419.1 hypothetical protein [Dysgonomonas sp. PH5-37]
MCFIKKAVTLAVLFAVAFNLHAMPTEGDAEEYTVPVIVPDTLGSEAFGADDEATAFSVKKLIVPTALVAAGVTVYSTPWLRKNIDKEVQKELSRHSGFPDLVDEALVFAPATAIFVLDWCGVPARHSFKDRMLVSASSAMIGLGTNYVAKSLIGRRRPDGSERNSFPSSHTTAAFIGAHILMKEYRHVSPWIGVGGYVAATAVGILRMTENRHWLSDVVAGAGWGMLSVEVGYLLLPWLSKTIRLGDRQQSLTVNPAFGSNWAGLGFHCAF